MMMKSRKVCSRRGWFVAKQLHADRNGPSSCSPSWVSGDRGRDGSQPYLMINRLCIQEHLNTFLILPYLLLIIWFLRHPSTLTIAYWLSNTHCCSNFCSVPPWGLMNRLLLCQLPRKSTVICEHPPLSASVPRHFPSPPGPQSHWELPKTGATLSKGWKYFIQSKTITFKIHHHFIYH